MANTLKTATYAGLFAVSLIPAAFGQDTDTGIATNLKPLESAPVLARKVVDHGTHTSTYTRIRPPVLAKRPVSPPEPQQELTSEAREAMERMAAKEYLSLSVTATVYVGTNQTVTALRWWDQDTGQQYQAYSNADFRHLTQIRDIETETHIYAWFPFVDSYELADMPAEEPNPIPAGITFEPGVVEYLLEKRAKADASQARTLDLLDHVHALYQISLPELKADYEKRMKEAAEREEELRKNPPVPRSTQTYWWFNPRKR
jgi:hypothetical protein